MTEERELEIAEILTEYQSSKELYRDFSDKIKAILESLLKTNGFRYQIVTSRVKGEESLRNKLEEKEEIKSLKDVKDLAGCRIILYLDGDIKRIIPHLYNEFGDLNPDLKYSDDSYNADHFIIELKENRLKLSEYKEFEDLKCEIQLTTILFHSWAELTHDIIYKEEKSISEFDPAAFTSMKNQFGVVMKEHIKEAQYSYDFIFYQRERIKEGKSFFDIEFLKSIVLLETNNETHQRLSILLEYIKVFGDKTPKELGIIEIITKVLKKAKPLKEELRRTAFGDLPGFTYEDVVRVCLEIVEHLRYFHPKEVFEILSLLSIDDNPKIKKQSLNVASQMAKHLVFPKEGKIIYHPQIIILNEMEQWNDKDLFNPLRFDCPTIGGTALSILGKDIIERSCNH